MIKIHILSKSGSSLNIAAYYPVPDNIYDPSSVDDARTPASDKLTTDEINALKLGHLFEKLAAMDVTGKDEAQVKTFLEQRYAAAEGNAMDEYKRLYSDYIGESWDGTTWG